ncbi:MAG: hypothetical protein EPO28_11845 [Saprospiraceae bacterium]|nr:MAG: hypothetical protein EPO28_11845 [Saprospiraceae bacterium]
MNDSRHQASFNKFFNCQNFDLEEVNQARQDMLHGNPGTCFKEKGVMSVDNSLLKHYGRHFDKIYCHYDYVHKCYRWAHDLVTLHYSDDLTDYPVLYRLWEPPDLEAVANYLRDHGFVINGQKWDKRATASLKSGATISVPAIKKAGCSIPVWSVYTRPRTISPLNSSESSIPCTRKKTSL